MFLCYVTVPFFKSNGLKREAYQTFNFDRSLLSVCPQIVPHQNGPPFGVVRFAVSILRTRYGTFWYGHGSGENFGCNAAIHNIKLVLCRGSFLLVMGKSPFSCRSHFWSSQRIFFLNFGQPKLGVTFLRNHFFLRITSLLISK